MGSIFRPYSSSDALRSDRSAGDRQRHRRKVREAIRQNIADVIAEESIIGKGGDKIIKVPIRGIKEYRFIYGENTPGVGQGDGASQPGQVIGKAKGEGQDADKAGDQPGVDYYETEVSLDELIEIMFEDLELPDMERKTLRLVFSERLSRPQGTRRVGIPARLKRHETARQHMRRAVASGFKKFENRFPAKLTEEEYQALLGQYAKDPQIKAKIEQWYYPDRERPGMRALRMPISKDDMRFKHLETTPKEESNAVVFCIMDTSGSMDTMKKYLARSFFFLLYQFVRTKYQHVEIIFIAHHTEGCEVTEDEFFHKGESGGTFISSGYLKTLEVIKERYHPDLWNIYAVHCSDGDNFESDNPAALKAAKELCGVANLVGYVEIKPLGSRYYESSMLNVFRRLEVENFQTTLIEKKEDLWPSFKALLAKDRAAVS